MLSLIRRLPCAAQEAGPLHEIQPYLNAHTRKLRLYRFYRLAIHQVASAGRVERDLEPVRIPRFSQQRFDLAGIVRVTLALDVSEGGLGHDGAGYVSKPTQDGPGDGLFIHSVVEGPPNTYVLERTLLCVDHQPDDPIEWVDHHLDIRAPAETIHVLDRQIHHHVRFP